MTDLIHAKIDLIGFNLKLLARKGKLSILISAGSMADKEYLLASCRDLVDAGATLYATPGTKDFFDKNTLASFAAHKISSDDQPNIRNLLEDGDIDFVINILTGDPDYDEASDAKQIRSIAIQQGIPLFTDREVAKETISVTLNDLRSGTYSYKARSEEAPWDLKSKFLELVQERGGFACHHGHFDKAYLISPENLALGFADMEKKWTLYRHLKESYTHEDLVERISRALETVVSQGAQYCRTMVDADSIVGLKPIQAALEVQEKYRGRIDFEVGIQPLEGVVEPASREIYIEACKLSDFCGGLPSRDRPQEAKHLDIIMSTAKDLGKMVEVHVDQENNPYQDETELLCHKTIEHGMEGRVYAIHSISLAAKDPSHQDRVIELLKEADIGVIICPSAALSMKPLPITAPLHNSIAPYAKLREAGVRCYLGVDNINDLFMPIVDGDMWTEARMLMEACRHYDLEDVAGWASSRPLHLH